MRIVVFLIQTIFLLAGDTSAQESGQGNDATQAVADHQLIALGERLFNDSRLSGDGKISCASCHIQAACFADARPLAAGIGGQIGTRNTPSLMNVGVLKHLFWDGRVDDLEAQVALPLKSPIEHGLASEEDALNKIKGDAQYAHEFYSAFGTNPEALEFKHVATAFAAYQRSLLSRESAYDEYRQNPSSTNFSAAALRGLKLFQGRAGCISCHTTNSDPSLFTDEKFHSSLALPEEVTHALSDLTARIAELRQKKQENELHQLITKNPSAAALGRFVVTLDPQDIGKFRTPSLRNVAKTAPYMHDGSITSLAAAIDLELYRRGHLKYPIILTSAEKLDLIEFLNALTDSQCQ
jgi:cytochrome c peroxidase